MCLWWSFTFSCRLITAAVCCLCKAALAYSPLCVCAASSTNKSSVALSEGYHNYTCLYYNNKGTTASGAKLVLSWSNASTTTSQVGLYHMRHAFELTSHRRSISNCMFSMHKSQFDDCSAFHSPTCLCWHDMSLLTMLCCSSCFVIVLRNATRKCLDQVLCSA